jgi:hypothetical protein
MAWGLLSDCRDPLCGRSDALCAFVRYFVESVRVRFKAVIEFFLYIEYLIEEVYGAVLEPADAALRAEEPDARFDVCG